MQIVEKVVQFLNFILWDSILLYLLTFVGLYFSIRMRFVQLRCFGSMMRLIKKDIKKKNSPKGVSGWQALCVTLSSRIGTGNVAGVALAIGLGGPGAVFWMWMFALIIGGSNSFIESVLAQIYKKKGVSSKGLHYFYGGTSYYIQQGLNAKILPILFTIMMIAYSFILNMVHAHTIGSSISHLYTDLADKDFMLKMTSVILPFLVMWPIFGGILRIAKISGYIVPIMAAFYVCIAMSIIMINIQQMPSVLLSIIHGAFDIKTSIKGGILGGVMVIGMKRAVFSADPGSGIAPYASSSAEAKHPVDQGFLQVFSIFFDTLIVCSSSAFMVLLADKKANVINSGLEGIQIAQESLNIHLGPWGPIFLSLAIFLFAFSSIIGNYFYGENSIKYFKVSQSTLHIYRCTMIVLMFVGTLMKFSLVWELADVIMGFLTLTNLIVLLFLGKHAINAFKDYEHKMKEGKSLSFTSGDIGMEGKIDAW